MLDISATEPMLGHTFVDRMNGSKHAVLRIGNDLYTRHRLVVELGIGNFKSAKTLSDLVDRLKLRSVRDLYLISPYDLAAEHGIGVTTLYVLMSLFDAKGLDVAKWYGLKSNGNGSSAVTFTTLKVQTAKRGDRKRSRRKSRRHPHDQSITTG